MRELITFAVQVSIVLAAGYLPTSLWLYRRSAWYIAGAALLIGALVSGVWVLVFEFGPGEMTWYAYPFPILLGVIRALTTHRDRTRPKREPREYASGGVPPWRRRAEGPIGPASRAFDAYKQRPPVWAPPEHDRW